MVLADDYFLIDSAFLGQTGPLAPPKIVPTDQSPGSQPDVLVMRAPQPGQPSFGTRLLQEVLQSAPDVLG